MERRLFQLPNKRGLTTALIRDGDMDGVLQETGIGKLRVITSGPSVPNPSELLGSEEMRKLIEQASTRADIVVFDSPATLSVTDSAILANQVDGVIFVVDAGRTHRPAAQRALESLRAVGADILGAVLNRISGRDWPGYYDLERNRYQAANTDSRALPRTSWRSRHYERDREATAEATEYERRRSRQ